MSSIMSQNVTTPALLRGRLVNRDGQTVTIRNQAGSHTATVTMQEGTRTKIGDWIEITPEGDLRVLTPNRKGTLTWMERTLDPKRVRALALRAKVENGIRHFFTEEDFLEVRTPLLVPCPGMETHIRPVQTTRGAYLPTSPEFAMKRLLVGGLERIFQLSRSFRDEPVSNTHHPEFTMLEWYRAFADIEEIRQDTERLIERLALEIHGKPSVPFQGKEISVKTPWPRLKVRDLFQEMCGVDLVKSASRDALAAECVRLGLAPAIQDTWDDLYFRIWLNLIEPKLPADRAVFVTRYPASQSALAVKVKDPDGSVWAERFEAYAGGHELANAFQELTDPVEQRKRFVEDMALRAEIYGETFPTTPLDEEFLEALEEGLPPSGGIALGVDRLILLLGDLESIGQTVWIDPIL